MCPRTDELQHRACAGHEPGLTAPSAGNQRVQLQPGSHTCLRWHRVGIRVGFETKSHAEMLGQRENCVSSRHVCVPTLRAKSHQRREGVNNCGDEMFKFSQTYFVLKSSF